MRDSLSNQCLSEPGLPSLLQNAVVKFIGCGIKVWLNIHSDNFVVCLPFLFALYSYRSEIILRRMWCDFGVHDSVNIYPTISIFRLGRPQKGMCKLNDYICTASRVIDRTHDDVITWTHCLLFWYIMSNVDVPTAVSLNKLLIKSRVTLDSIHLTTALW